MMDNLELFKIDNHRYPSTEEGLRALITKPKDTPGWAGPYARFKGIPNDPWRHPYVYRSPSTRPDLDFDLCSYGPTGRPDGTGEDAPICNEPASPH